MPLKTFKTGHKRLKKMYIKILLFFVGRGLKAASYLDQELIAEIEGLPDNFSFILEVLPNGPKMALKKTTNNRFKYIGSTLEVGQASVAIQIKNIEAAMLLFTFRESTAIAYSNNRMIVKGDLDKALAIVRCLNIIEVYLLPKLIARLAVKRYPNWPVSQIISRRIRIYIRAVLGY